MLYYKPLIFFAYRLKCNCFPGSRLLRIALKYERIKFEISHQKFSDKHFRLSNQDGIIAKKGVVNKSKMSSYGLNGKKFLQGCKGFYFCWIWHKTGILMLYERLKSISHFISGKRNLVSYRQRFTFYSGSEQQAQRR